MTTPANNTGAIPIQGAPSSVPVTVMNSDQIGGSGAGSATAANQTTQITTEQAIQASVASIDTKTPAAPATAGNQTAEATLIGAVTEAAPATDTASSGLNGRLQRIAQRLSSLIALLPAALGAGGGLKVDGSGTALPVNGTVGVSGNVAVTKADGSDVAEGMTTDAAASSTVAENATARTGIGLWKGIKNILILLNAKFVAGTNIGVVGGTTIPQTSVFTRVADTNAYAVGDCIGSTVSNTGTTPLLGVTVAGANGGTGYLTKIRLWTDQAANVAVFRIHFYTVAQPTTAIPGDNVANGLFYTNFAQRVGYVDMPAMTTETSGNTAAHAQDITTRLSFTCDPADTKLYYRLQTQTVFTPTSAQSFSLELTAERNGA